MVNHIAIIPAAGSGQRFGATPKQYTVLAGKMMLSHTVQALINTGVFTHIYIAHAPGDARIAAVMQELISCEQVVLLPTGGATRAETVFNTLQQCQLLGVDLNDWVWVHDAARPGVTAKDIYRMNAAIKAGAKTCILACQVADTLKLASDSAHVVKTVDRESMWSAQTPQVSQMATLIHALNVAQARGVTVTDEASAIESVGVPIQLVQGTLQNFKVTYAADAALMEVILEARNKTYRIGEGMDVHALVSGRKLILGGIHIPFERGLLGHSDADALCHAMTDAILGAAAMGDIGRMFPDTDKQFQGADSTELLALAYQAVKQAGWMIENIDATVIAQAPKLAPYIDSMQAKLINVLGLDEHAINIKAKTNENLGYLGRNEGIECRATVLLSKSR